MKFALCFVALICLTSGQLIPGLPGVPDLKVPDLKIPALKILDLKLNVGVKLDVEIVLGTIDEDLLLTEEVGYQQGQRNKVVTTFASFHGEPNVVITAVQIIPNANSKGSQITLTNGGLGQNFITLRVDSALGEDNNFTFRVYGIYKKGGI